MTITLIIYCGLILVASLLGGLLPLYIKLTHKRMQLALSFVSGVMLGVALLHLLPHAWVELAEAGEGASIDLLVQAMLVGFLAMFLLERFFCFHHHEDEGWHGSPSREEAGQTPVPPDTSEVTPGTSNRSETRSTNHGHALAWTGAAVGMTVHSILAGVALAASARAESHGDESLMLVGFGTFLVIVLHKPFDSLTIGTLMAAGGRSTRMRHVVNGLFALAVPLGVLLFMAGLSVWSGSTHQFIAAALAFAAGMFLCISLSDLLPELQFHKHDRIKLTTALLAGLALAWVVGVFEGDLHEHGVDDHQHDEAGHVHEGE